MRRPQWMVAAVPVAAALAAVVNATGVPPACAESPVPLWVVTRPAGAHVVLDGAMRVDGVAPFVVDRGLAGVYEVTASLPGYTTWRSRVALSPAGGDSLVIALHRLSRTGAALRSLALPGWGQRYLGRDGSGTLLFYGTAAMGAFAAYEQARYSAAADEYDTLRSAYAGATQPEAIRLAYAAMESQYGEVRDHRDRRNGFLWAGAAVWAVGIVDALIRPPEESPVVVSAAPGNGGTLAFALRRGF